MPRKKRPENTFSLCFSKFSKIFMLSMFFQYKRNNRNGSYQNTTPFKMAYLSLLIHIVFFLVE